MTGKIDTTPWGDPGADRAGDGRARARRALGRAVMLAAASLMLGAGAPAWAAAQGNTTPPATAPTAITGTEAEQITKLTTRLTSLLSGNPNMTIAQALGQLILAVNQGQVSCSVAQGALGRVQAASADQTPTQRAAVSQAVSAAASCKNGSIAAPVGGTTNNQTLANGSTLGLSSGASNYQQP